MAQFPTLNETHHLTTISDWVRFCASQMSRHQCFFGHGFDNAWSEACFLVLRHLHLDWDVPETAFNARITPTEAHSLHQTIRQRCVDKVPVAYLVSEGWFMNRPFSVSPEVLIPRSPIAELIENQFYPWLKDAPNSVLDLCTGSGCIGISLAYAFPDAAVDISDISEQALEIAQRNVSDHGMDDQVSVYLGDLFESLHGQKYDLIVSNPPYVDAEDLADMPAEFHHEPRLGLEAGDDGLEIVNRLLLQSPDYLTEQGWLVCEVGNSAGALVDCFPEVPFVWPEFERGGHGIFLLSREHLLKHQSLFVAHAANNQQESD